MIVALMLQLSTVVTWLLAGGALVRYSIVHGGGMLILSVPGSLICLVLGLLGALGAWTTWRGKRPGCSTFVLQYSMLPMVALLCFGWLRSLLPGRITGTERPMEFQPTMLIPIVLAALQVVALVLLSTESAEAWSAKSAPPRNGNGTPPPQST